MWLRVDTTLWSHEKILALPSDAARWSWLVLLSRAKERDGAFSSETQLKVDLGSRYRWVIVFRELGLLDGLQVHDWDAYQLNRDNSTLRTRRWRERRAGDGGDGDGDASRDGPTGTVHRQGHLEREKSARERTLPDASTRAAVSRALGRHAIPEEEAQPVE